MKEELLNPIIDALKTKASTKQKVYRTTLEAFKKIKESAKKTQQLIDESLSKVDSSVEVLINDRSDFEFHFKFGGDTLIFMMHTNVFKFPPEHFIHKSDYIKTDPTLEYCGLINVYNFLSDSVKYNREADLGFLVARIYINKENHFFIEGKRPLNFLYNNLGRQELNNDSIEDIIQKLMTFSLDFELYSPNYEQVKYITLEQKNIASYGSGNATNKRLGFQFSAKKD